MTSPEVAHKPKRARSPNYPGIPLGAAIDRARLIYAKEGRHSAPVIAVFRDLGYSPGSGMGGVVIGALKKFGLVADAGSGESRQIQLTEQALKILLDERPDSAERAEAIRQAALTPPIHAELWQKYGSNLPSDATLRYRLLTEKGFTEAGAAEFIEVFKGTVAFAGLSDEEGETGQPSEETADTADNGEDSSADNGGDARRNDQAHRGGLGTQHKRGDWQASELTVLSFQVSGRRVEVATRGGPLTKDEIVILKDYLTIQERIAPDSLSLSGPRAESTQSEPDSSDA